MVIVDARTDWELRREMKVKRFEWKAGNGMF